MKFALVLLALVAAVTATDVAAAIDVTEQVRQKEAEDLTQNDYSEWTSDDGAESAESPEISEFGLILNSQARKVVRNLVKQLPCGWPNSGIPPLAPYTNRNLELQFDKAFVDALMQFIRIRFDGLNDLQIINLRISYTFKKKVRFHFNFKQLKATAKSLNMDALVDLMKKLGIAVRYEGSGPLDFSLENLSVEGHFKYTMPFFIGSIQIYKFVCVVRLGGVQSNIGGLLGNGNVNKFINYQIEQSIPAIINDYQKEISDLIASIFVPRVNQMLRGKKVWDVLDSVAKSSSDCNPDPAPWSLIEPENEN